MSNNYIPNNVHFLKRARNIRNELLNRTDRYFLIDYPIAVSYTHLTLPTTPYV